MKQSIGLAPRRRGAALGLAVLLMLILSITGLTAIQVARAGRERAVQASHLTAARYAADAGIERALYQMNQALAAGTWNAGAVPTFSDEPLTATNAQYSVTASSLGGHTYELVSVGVSGQTSRTVRATVQLSSPIAMDLAVLAKNTIELKNKAVVKGFDSSDPTRKDLKADIGTLSSDPGSIVIKNGAEVYGDVYIGVDGDPDKAVSKGSDSVKGEIFKAPNPMSVKPPKSPSMLSKGKISGNNVTLTAADSGTYSSIEISNNGKMRINGHVLLNVTGNIELKNSAEVAIASNGSLTLYLAGNLEAKNSSGFSNESKVPAKLKLYGTGNNQTLELKNSADLYGVVYAPNASMELHNGANVYGALVVNDLEMKNSGNLFYDVALKNVNLTDPGAQFRVVRWEEL